ncbi:MAG: hypothetical protein R3E53_19615 [Myxococcota bacterium]
MPFLLSLGLTGANIHGLRRGAPLDDRAADYLVNVWKRNLDEIRAQNGVMVVPMHPDLGRVGLDSPGCAASSAMRSGSRACASRRSTRWVGRSGR